jgi:hypothetical protein
MSIYAINWAFGTPAGHPLSRWLLVVMADLADADNVTTASLDYLGLVSEMPWRSLHFHIKQLQAQGLITPVLGPADQHGRSAVIGYRLALPVPVRTATQYAKTRPAPLERRSRKQKNAAETEAHDPIAEPPITLAAGSRAWWATFWSNIMDEVPTVYMVTEGEQGHPWPVAARPTEEQEEDLAELNEEQGAAWEIWLAGRDARFPQHELPENPGKMFAPHPWPRELV